MYIVHIQCTLSNIVEKNDQDYSIHVNMEHMDYNYATDLKRR